MIKTWIVSARRDCYAPLDNMASRAVPQAYPWLSESSQLSASGPVSPDCIPAVAAPSASPSISHLCLEGQDGSVSAGVQILPNSQASRLSDKRIFQNRLHESLPLRPWLLLG